MNDSANSSVLCEYSNGIGWLTLNRPEAINAVNDGIRTELPAALAAFDRNPQVKVIVLSGAGPRGFCVGADIKEARGAETPVAARRRMIGNAWIESLDRVTKPVIAAIHGFCFGGGLELALACDIRIAAPDAKFALPEIDLGLIPGGGGTQRMAQLIGMGRTLDLLLTAERIDAEEALRIGLITRLAPSVEALRETAQQLAQHIAAKPAVAAAYIKEAVRSGASVNLANGLRLEKNLFSLLLTTEDRAEAAAAFREKRAPRFEGK